MRIVPVLAAAAALFPVPALALTVDDFTLRGLVYDQRVDVAAIFAPNPAPSDFVTGTLTQALSPLVTRTMTLDEGPSGFGSAANSFVSNGGGLTFNSGLSGEDALATITYAFSTVLDVSAGTTGFSFGTGAVDGANVLEATLFVMDADGNGASSGPIDITATPGSVDFAYANLPGIDLSRIKTVSLELQNTTFGTDGRVATSFTAEGGSLAPIPLPAGLPLLVAGLGGLALLRRRAA